MLKNSAQKTAKKIFISLSAVLILVEIRGIEPLTF